MDHQNKTMERHPYSAAWGDVAEADFLTLVKSVRDHGVLEPLVLFDGKVLDGWHRYRAANEVGITFESSTFDGSEEDAISHVLARHTRRNLTASQRAAAVLLMHEYRTGSGRPQTGSVTTTTKQVAQMSGASERTVASVRSTAQAAAGEEPSVVLKAIRDGEIKPARQAQPQKDIPPQPEMIAVPAEEWREVMHNLEIMRIQLESVQAVTDGEAAKALISIKHELESVKETRDASMRRESELIKQLRSKQRTIDSLNLMLTSAPPSRAWIP